MVVRAKAGLSCRSGNVTRIFLCFYVLVVFFNKAEFDTAANARDTYPKRMLLARIRFEKGAYSLNGTSGCLQVVTEKLQCQISLN